MKILYTTILACLLLSCQAQSNDNSSVVKNLANIMNRNYVYPGKGEAMHDLLLANLDKGEYSDYSDPSELSSRLEKDLRSIINDKHIRVMHNPERAEAVANRDIMGGRKPPARMGFEKVEILDGNIGYLDLRGFMEIRFAEEYAVPAMDKLIDSDAIIFDLRQNGGGSPSMIRFICSYLFEKPTHLNSFYWRPADSYSETWSDPNIASQSKEDIPVYILTSDYTFSAAEEFSYDLKHLERATLVGEVTGGGAHPGGPMLIENGFIVNVPQGRAINPITKSNWEGVGVKPHIEIEADLALEKALELAKNALKGE